MPIIKHKKTSEKADLSNTSLVRPSDWNNDHNINSVGSSVYLGQNATGAGPILELPIVATSGDDFTLWTKAAIQAAITAAITNFHPFATGDVIASLATSRSGGWVLCNGQTLNIANGTPNHNLFVLLWGINGGTWPVSPSRGANAEADWTAGKQVPVPDMSGCTLGMVDPRSPGTSVNTLLTQFGTKVGIEKLFLTVPQMPTHTHTSVVIPGSNAASVGGPVAGVVAGTTGATGGDPDATPAYANPLPINLTQPTVGVNYFIKL